MTEALSRDDPEATDWESLNKTNLGWVHMEHHGTPKNWWFVDVSPFPRGIFRFQPFVFRGVVFVGQICEQGVFSTFGHSTFLRVTRSGFGF